MPRVAIFVDAGYLFAQGSTALTGSKKKRIETRLDKNAVLAELLAVAKEKADGASLLRIYWYDGALGYGGPTLEQEAIASSDNVKLRLGFINKAGQQKGVDSLIVTDLINLARNNAISDALLMSGDEDVRIGVEIAQGFGVRIHLLGIVPGRGSQSKQLLFEADTTVEWSKDTVSKFLEVTLVSQSDFDDGTLGQNSDTESGGRSVLANMVVRFVGELDEDQLSKLTEHWSQTLDVPPEYDRRLLAKGRAAIGRNLDSEEKRFLRNTFRDKTGSPSP